uniref:Fibroblast activation protein, alpha n=1 Tax=Gadus morhua TaxID=8049 RepID=A0A8C4ZL00_GADMO
MRPQDSAEQLFRPAPQGGGKVLWIGVAAAAITFFIIIPVAVHLNRANDANKRSYTLDDYFNSTIKWKSYKLRWISDNTYLHKREGNVFLYNVETKEESLYLSNLTFASVDAIDYLLSGDQKYVSLESNYTKQWRHSYTASYSIFSQNDVTPDHLPVQAYISDFNIYLTATVTSEPVQVTFNGKKNEILNGVPDWAYEEEVLASNEAVWWSTSSRFLAFLQINDSQVHSVEFTFYGSEQYPVTRAVPYPKAGSTLPRARLLVMNQPAPSCPLSDYFLSSVTWVTDERVAVQWLNRRQNHVHVQIYDSEGDRWREGQSFVQTSGTGWVGHYSPLPLFFAADNISFYKVMSDSLGYKHIHHVRDGVAVPVTSGQWEVIYITKLTTDAIYYISNEHNAPGVRNVYRLGIGSSVAPPHCLSCDVRRERCQYSLAYMSANASYCRMDCYGQSPPPLSMILICSRIELKVLEDNSEIQSLLDQFHLPTVRRGTLKIAGFDLWYQMLLPPNFKKSQKYPLLIDVYGGPCSQKVDYGFRLNWGTYLASTEGIIVASFDGRGSGYQGDHIMHSIYKRLGTYEVEDQMTYHQPNPNPNTNPAPLS